MIVMKFGGTSIGSGERIRACADLVKRELARRPVVVVSAFGGVTDALIRIGAEAEHGDRSGIADVRERHERAIADLDLDRDLVAEEMRELEALLRGIALTRELTPRTRDYLLSFGERMACRIVAAAFEKKGLSAVAIMAYDLGVRTDSTFGQARPLPGIDGEIRKALGDVPEGTVPVVTGFIAKDPEERLTTLGRSGSDYTATLIAAAAKAEEVQIWTDVDGVLTADPRVVPEARLVEELGFEEARELAYYGTKFIHPATLLPAIDRRIPVRILNAQNPSSPGTRITKEAAPSATVAKTIVFKRDVSLVNVVSTRMLGQHGFLARMAEVFAKHGVSIDMIATSEVSVSLTVPKPEGLERVAQELSSFAQVEVSRGKASVCIVGAGLRDTRGIAAKIFEAVAGAGVNVLMITQGASKINVGFVVDSADVEPCVRALHAAFFA